MKGAEFLFPIRFRCLIQGILNVFKSFHVLVPPLGNGVPHDIPMLMQASRAPSLLRSCAVSGISGTMGSSDSLQNFSLMVMGLATITQPSPSGMFMETARSPELGYMAFTACHRHDTREAAFLWAPVKRSMAFARLQPARPSHIRSNGDDMRSLLMWPAVSHPGSFSHILTDITVPVAIRMLPHFPKPNFQWSVMHIPRRDE